MTGSDKGSGGTMKEIQFLLFQARGGRERRKEYTEGKGPGRGRVLTSWTRGVLLGKVIFPFPLKGGVQVSQ